MNRLRLSGVPVLAGILLLSSCAPIGKESSDFGFYEEREAPVASRLEAAPEMDMKSGASESPSEPADSPDSIRNDSGSRKRIYNGSTGLIVESVEETRRGLESLTRESGGYVESSYSDYLVLRVPADQFDLIFSQILGMGQVEFSRVETWDVTEAFADNERRLITAEETRARLYVLLENSRDPAERAGILREIGRLTEEIESLKQQLSILSARVMYSRITVQLIPRIQGEFSREDIPFRWIADLDPLVPAGSKLRGRVVFDLGDDFAVFTKESVFMAENSSGVHITISSVPNEPRGDGVFWQQALKYHLSPYYAESMERDIRFGKQSVLGVELVSKDREPFRYFVGVIPDSRFLHVVEIFAPGADKKFDEYYASLSKGEIR